MTNLNYNFSESNLFDLSKEGITMIKNNENLFKDNCCKENKRSKGKIDLNEKEYYI